MRPSKAPMGDIPSVHLSGSVSRGWAEGQSDRNVGMVS